MVARSVTVRQVILLLSSVRSLGRRSATTMLGLLAMLLASGCTAAVPAQPPDTETGAPPAGATSFETYGDAFCAAWHSMFTAVGNPESGEGSELSLALDVAVEAKDGVNAALLAEQIDDHLEAGRTQVAVAAAWPPAAESMRHLDRLFVALQAMTDAHVPLALGAPDATDPQAIFEEAGGIDAWTAFLQAYQAMAPERPAGPVTQCQGLPIGP